MKRIIIKHLTLENFKGVRKLDVNFEGHETFIYGDNATGKTTIADAIRWLLFDKDSTDRKDFGIKTLDKNNNVIHGLEHKVRGIFEIGGVNTTLEKVYKEKWTKKRGEAGKELTGHETKYMIDDVPKKKSEYEKYLSEIIDEKTFKVLTEPCYFSTKLNWQERRSILLEIAGKIDVEGFENIKAQLVNKSEDDYKKSLQYQKKQLNERLVTVPARIDEQYNSIVDTGYKSPEDVQKELASIESQISKLDNRIAGLSKESRKAEITKRIRENKARIEEIISVAEAAKRAETRKIADKIGIIENKADEIKREIELTEKKVLRLTDELTTDAERLEELRRQYTEKAKEKFTGEVDRACPTCGREFESGVVEDKLSELHAHFNANKAKELERIQQEGKALRTEYEEKKKVLATLNDKISKLKEELTPATTLTELKSQLETAKNKEVVYPEEYYKLQKEIELLEEESSLPDETEEERGRLEAQRHDLTTRKDELIKTQSVLEQNRKIQERIEELKTEEKEVNGAILEVEKALHELEQYVVRKVSLLESAVNGKFNYVKFKLFKEQINGGIQEICEPLIGGVPFSDANNAAKVNAGIDIINALTDYYGISAPIVIDNRESVKKLIDTPAQVINLIVSDDKQLRVSNITNNKKVA